MCNMADDIDSSSDLSDLESSWNPLPPERLSYEEIVAGSEHKDVKDELNSTLVKYGFHEIPDIEEVLKRPFIDSNKSFLPSWSGYAILISGNDRNTVHLNDIGDRLRSFGVEVNVIPGSSRKQFVKSLLCLVFYATVNESHVPVIIGYCGRVRDLKLELSDGGLDLHLIDELLSHLPPDEIVIPVIEGFDPDVRVSIQNDFFAKLQQQQRPYICYQAERSDDSSIFSHLSEELKTTKDLKTIFQHCSKGHPENVKSAPTTEAIHLSDIHSEEPELCSCGCREECSAGYIVHDGGRCKTPNEHRSIPVLPKQGSDDIDPDLRHRETKKILDAIYFLLEKFCYSLGAIEHSSLVLAIRSFFPLLKEMTSASDDLECSKIDIIDRLCYYVIDRAEWITKGRLKEFAETIDCREACDYLDRIEECIDKLIDVDRLVRAESISYPAHCHRTSMEHYLFIIDKATTCLPFSALYPLHCRVQEKLCRHMQAHVFVSFSTYL